MPAAPRIAIEMAIVATNLTRRFGSFTAVDAISFDVKPGEVFGFLDRKSTRLNSSHT